MRRRCLLVIMATLLSSLPARAVPPDKVVLLEPGDGHFEQGRMGNWLVTSSNPKVVKAQWFDTNEVFLEAVGLGQAYVVLVNHQVGQAMIWKVKVAAQGSALVKFDPVAVLKGSCTCAVKEDDPPLCDVATAACARALLEKLRDADLSSDELYVRYTSTDAMQAVLRGIRERLDQAGFAKVEATFSGANIKLSGSVSDEESYAKLLLSVYEAMVGKLVIEDQVTVGSKGGEVGPEKQKAVPHE